MEYLVVKFIEDRGVIVDEAAGAWRTNRTLMLQAGTHNITLAPPQSFQPLEQEVVLTLTSVTDPMVITFTHIGPPAKELGAALLERGSSRVERLAVFICGTSNDLVLEREAVLDAIRRLQFVHVSMEFFGARDKQPIETCLEEVRKSDILLVIVGHQYGSLVPNRQISYSEAEYDEGYRLRKPCLVYMRDENVPILPKHMEQDTQKLDLLRRWRAKLRTHHTIAPFQDHAKLAVQVTADLARHLQDLQKGEIPLP